MRSDYHPPTQPTNGATVFLTSASNFCFCACLWRILECLPASDLSLKIYYTLIFFRCNAESAAFALVLVFFFSFSVCNWIESDGNSWTSCFIWIWARFNTPSSPATIANVTSTLRDEASKRLHIWWHKRYYAKTDATIWKAYRELDAQLSARSGRHQFKWYVHV